MSGAIRTVEDDALDAVAAGRADDPFALLGPHASTHNGRPALVIRTMQPSASAVELVTADRVIAMGRRHPDGLFEATLDAGGVPISEVAYRFRIHEAGETRETVDP